MIERMRTMKEEEYGRETEGKASRWNTVSFHWCGNNQPPLAAEVSKGTPSLPGCYVL